jgi:phage shock protein PspC (stress-responsive transcriptional regulator)
MASIVPYGAAHPALQEREDGACPAVWTHVKADLNNLFMTGNQCNDLARAAIRAIFHDCGSWDTSQGLTGGCDGSLILGVTPDVELARAENRGLQPIAGIIGGLAGKYGTSVSDMIIFAASSFPSSPRVVGLSAYVCNLFSLVFSLVTDAAIILCPGGPKVKTFIGRKDSTISAPHGGLPDVFDSAANLAALFAKKGLSAEDLAALLGAHSASTQKFVDPTQFNKSQDST